MAFIIQGFGNEQRIQLGAEEIVRPMVWGTNWTKIRIGMRLAVNGQNNMTNAVFSVGVTQGSRGFWDPNVVDAIAGAPGNALSTLWTGTWGYAFGTIGSFGMNTSGNTSMRKVGSQILTNVTVNSSIVYCAAQPNLGSFISLYFMDITKIGNGTVRFDQFGHTLAGVPVNVTRFWMLYQLENETLPLSAPAVNCGSNTGGLLSITGSSQLWDNICISWSRSIPVMEIADVTVLRYY